MRVGWMCIALLLGLALIAPVGSLGWWNQGVAVAGPMAQAQERGMDTTPLPVTAAGPLPTVASYPPPPTAVTGARTPGPYGWVIEVVDRGQEFVGTRGATKGRYPSLALDSAGRPYISYYDEYKGSLAYAQYNGNAWQLRTVETTYPSGWYGSSISLGRDLRPHILFCPYGTNGYVFACWGLKLADWNGSAFQIRVIKTQWGDGTGLSLSLDRSDRPYASYVNINSGKLEIAYSNGDAWTIQTIGDAGYGLTSLDLDSSDRPHVAYPSPPEKGLHLNYAYFDGTKWLTTTVDSAAETGRCSSLALDDAGRPHISYFDPSSAVLKYAWHDGTAWRIEVVDSEDAAGLYTSLALDANGQPHIAYSRLYGVGDPSCNGLKYAYRSGSSWQAEVVDSGKGVGCGLSMGLDAAGHPHIAYYGNYSLKYALRTLPATLPELGGPIFEGWIWVVSGVLIVAGLALLFWVHRRAKS